MVSQPQSASSKAHARSELLAARAAKEIRSRTLDDEALVQRLQSWLATSVGDLTEPVIAAYVPAGDEPGATLPGENTGQGFVDHLVSAIANARLMLPVCPLGAPQPLRWGYYTGTLRKGRFGLLEPVPADSAFAPGELEQADAIILPALAADPVTGMRLGRGAGYYDRSLVFARREESAAHPAAIAVVVFDEELREGLAFDTHDIPADFVITPSAIRRTQVH
ncbi:MAG: 5-formyltetrahydrofolate cyclo-ligase [Corynebacterium sp.]|uniref:5-formyltetrahydrofolate cyclo-ligase n=1 Tax=Corynebacterium sp. TaxID=1720 RepID=UPI0026DD5596|nr:5-formyltetrahydrofolate cyclo-ligase [Corynebacterium sp.]MDO5030494.1 5-formyltetrahydrofolate cyclo-ligase [Corynebacterium sp.]